jgi:hypothetical protein
MSGFPDMLVYFDTNVFDPRDGVAEADEDLVLDALRSQRFRLVFDLDCFLEPLLAFQGLPAAVVPRAARQLERMLKWCDRRRTVTAPQWLLAQSVLSYSGHRARVEEFLDREQLDQQVERELTDWDGDCSPRSTFWQAIASDAQREREGFRTSFTNLLQELGPRDRFAPGARPPTLAEFWNEHKYRVARTFVDSVGEELKQAGLWERCGERGIDGLLDLKCISLAVGATIAHMYAHFYNDGQQIPKIKQSEVADVRHAIAASVAEVFVTNDWRRFGRRLWALPIKDLRIVELTAFLTALRSE